MPRKPRESSIRRELEALTLIDIQTGRHSSLEQTAIVPAMKAGDEDVQAIVDFAPSLSGPTHTSEPVPDTSPGTVRAREAQRVSSPDRRRDPERYQFIGEHARGGLGRVSRVHDRELGRDIAVKELLSRTTVDEVRFLREVLITARLEHPGIVPVYEAGRWPDGTPFYAMKLVSGRPLRELIAERPVEDRIGLLHHVIAVADAMAYAHGRNIIHRDLKPANVIVGDFGETIVIDWGLAKDLTTSDEPTLPSSSPAPRSDDLTSTGCVLGTPAYMAPEQQRGEYVDQRADVFAIGTMLWELCWKDKAPPASARVRRQTLRRAGIDRDLIAIIDKALDPVPTRRYADAGALAADLKAFKSGARIAARSYSLLAMLAHWTRHHRALALSALATVAIATTVSVLYVRSVTAERDRATRSEQDAERARAEATKQYRERTLTLAQSQLTTDPSAAIDTLATYEGADAARAEQIRAEARGRGVAILRALPHTHNVLNTLAAPDGSILSVSIDGTIARTSRDGASAIVVRGVSRRGHSIYSATRRLLAYLCDPADICLFDTARASRTSSEPALREVTLSAMSFSPDGTLLAVMSQEGVLKVVDVTEPHRPAVRLERTFHGGVDVDFLGDDVLVAGTTAGVEVLHLGGSSERFPLTGVSRWDVTARERRLVLGTESGQVVALEISPVRVVARADLCRGPLAELSFVHGRRSVAYACREGTLGIWDLQRNIVTPRAQLEGHGTLLAASPDGDHVVAASGNGTVVVLDLATDLISYYRGHGFRLTSLTPPSAAHPFILSGDVRGAVRAWPLPARLTRIAVTSRSPFHAAIFDHRSIVTATTLDAALTRFSPSTGAETVEPHRPGNMFMDRSRSGSTFVTYGLNDTIEVWSTGSMKRTHVLETGHGSISLLRFVDDSDDFITSGNDGRLVRWTPSGEREPLVSFGQRIDHFASAGATESIVFSTSDGSLWRTGRDRLPRLLRIGVSRVNRMFSFPDRQTLYVGHVSGEVLAIDTSTWQQDVVLRAAGAVQEIAATADGQIVAVATNDGTIHVGTRSTGGHARDTVRWQHAPARARHISMTDDGLLVATCTDGAIWLYFAPRQRWLYLPTGTVDLGRTVVTPAGEAAVALGFEGRLLWIDLQAARALLGIADQPVPTRSH
jgi:eukaryotic-like serine/threonine-protein kinase